MKRLLTIIAIVAQLPLTLSCGGKKGLRAATTPAEQDYLKAVRLQDDRQYELAIDAFRDVKSKYPYSQFAALAELGIADTYFRHHLFVEAIDAYREFNKLHPKHDKIPSSYYQIATCYRLETPGAIDRDLSNAQSAISAYQYYIKRFPNDPQSKEAVKYRDQLGRKINQHDLYVAKFYIKRKKFKASQRRLTAIMKRSPIGSLREETLFLLGKSYAYLGDRDLANDSFSELKNDFPKSGYNATIDDVLSRGQRWADGQAQKTAKRTPADGEPSETKDR